MTKYTKIQKHNIKKYNKLQKIYNYKYSGKTSQIKNIYESIISQPSEQLINFNSNVSFSKEVTIYAIYVKIKSSQIKESIPLYFGYTKNVSDTYREHSELFKQSIVEKNEESKYLKILSFLKSNKLKVSDVYFVAINGSPLKKKFNLPYIAVRNELFWINKMDTVVRGFNSVYRSFGKNVERDVEIENTLELQIKKDD